MGRVISTALQFIDGFTRPSKQAIDSMRKMGNEAIKAGKQMQNAGKSISNVGSNLTKSITLPIVGVAAAAVKMSNDFENSMAKVGTIADTTAVPMETLKKQVVSLSNTVGVGVSDIAEAQYQAISAGVKTANSVDFVSTAIKAAKGGFTDATTAVDGLTTVLNAYGLEASKATDISDQMLVAQNYGKTSFGDMASSMGKVIPIASSLNVSTQELFSSIAVLTKNGIGTSEAVTGLKAAYSNILKPTADASKAAKSLGLDFSAAHLSSVGWAQFLTEIKEKTGGNAETMASLFGSTEALNSVMVLAGKGSKDFTEALGLMGDATGATQAAYEKMLTPAERMNISITKVKNSLIQFGAALTPVFNKFADIIGSIGDRLNNLSEGQVNAIVKFAAVAAAVGPVILIFGKTVMLIGGVTREFGSMFKTMANFKGIAGLITSPAGIVIGVLAAIAVAAFLIIKNWDHVKKFLSNVGNWFKSAFEKAGYPVEAFKNKFASIGNTIGGIGEKVKGILKGISKTFLADFAGGITEGTPNINKALQGFAGEAAAMFDTVVTAADDGLKAFSALIDFFTGGFTGDWNKSAQGFKSSIKSIFGSDVADGLIKAFDKALPVIIAASEGIKASFAGIVEDAKKIFGNFKTILGGVGTFFKGIFTGDFETALGGFKTACEGALDAIGNIFKAKIHFIKNFVVTALSNFLPKSTMNAIALAFDTVAESWDVAISAAKGYVEGFVKAVKPIFDNLKTIIGGIAKFVKGVFTGDWKTAFEGLKAITSGALSGLVNIIKAPFTIIGNIVKGAINGFKNLTIVKTIFTAIGNAIKNVLSKSGVDLNKFASNVNNIKTRVSSIINNLKTIFGTVFGAIGKVVKAVASVIANIFGKKVSDTCNTAGAVITAFKAVASTAFKVIAAVVKTAMAVIVPVVKVAFSAIAGGISAAVQNITAIISGLMTVFDGITTFISGVFTGNWSKAWEGIKTIFKGVFDSFAALAKTPINAVIGIINGAISGINKLDIKIPDWVPMIGGKGFDLNIPTIPMLYKGTSNWQGGTAVIHDRGGEIVDLPKGSRVYPHDKSIAMAKKEGAATAAGAITITIQKLADKIEVRSDEDIDRIAEALALKLKKVALNTGTV